MIILVKDQEDEYHEIKINSNESKLVSVSNGIAAAIINPSKNISKILVLADKSWRPNDNEMENVNFENYNWKKWDNA